MMLMIPRRGQGVAGEVSGSLGQVVQSMVQVVELPSFAPFLIPLVISVLLLHGLQGVEKQAILPLPQILRSDSPAPPLGSVEVGSAVAIDEPHLHYKRSLAPL